MPAPQITRDEVLKRILEVFRRYGYEGASLAHISKATGLGRSSLYHYFPEGKQDMAVAVLKLMRDWIEANVIGALKSSKSPSERILAMCRVVDEFYAGGRERCLLANFVMAESLELFKEPMRAILSAWIEALAKVLVESGIGRKEAKVRAEDAVLRVQGGLILSIALGDPTTFRRSLNQIEERILEPSF